MKNMLTKVRIRLARVGHENVIGYLEGGMLAWHIAGFPIAFNRTNYGSGITAKNCRRFGGSGC